MDNNVVNFIANSDNCIGCGVCAGICPNKTLKIDFNNDGCLKVFQDKECLQRCELCLKICPFSKNEFLNDEKYSFALSQFFDNKNMKFDKNLGYFLDSFEFFYKDDDKRLKSASGGALNFTIKKLFEKDLIDRVICVGKGDDKKLFDFMVFDKSSIDILGGSAYYPVSLDDAIKFILKNDFRYCITALPCASKALRLAMKNNHKLRNRIKFILGLVCGQGKSANYAQNVANLAFKKDVKIKNINFRHKIENRSAMAFGCEIESIDGEKAIDYREFSALHFWSSRAFTPMACNSCDDVYSKYADAVFMDAWLNDKILDYKGHSLILSRNKEISDIFLNEKENFLKQIDESLILLSQKDVILSKNEFCFGNKNLFKNRIIKIKKEIQKHTLINPDDIEFIKKNMKKIEKISKIENIFSIPKRVILKIKRVIKERI